MKYIFGLLVLIVVLAVVFKMEVLNEISSGGREGYRYTSYNWPFSRINKESILAQWKEMPASAAAVRKLLTFDFIFIIIYTIALCNWSYKLLQNQNRLWLNIWLRMGIFCIFLTAFFNLAQDYFNFISLDTGQAFFLSAYIYALKWLFALLGLAPVGVSLFLPPLRTRGTYKQ